MNAKQAIFEELGDLFSDMPVAEDEQKSTSTSGDEDILVSEDVILEPIEEDNTEEQDANTAGNDETSNTRDMSYQERIACIKAANQAMLYNNMSPEASQWGYDFIDKMYREMSDQMQANIDKINWEEEAARSEQEDAEEEQQANSQRDKMLGI